MKVYLSERDLAHVLAALRILQTYMGGSRVSVLDVACIMTDDGKHYPMKPRELDALCERINTRWEEA